MRRRTVDGARMLTSRTFRPLDGASIIVVLNIFLLEQTFFG